MWKTRNSVKIIRKLSAEKPIRKKAFRKTAKPYKFDVGAGLHPQL